MRRLECQMLGGWGAVMVISSRRKRGNRQDWSVGYAVENGARFCARSKGRVIDVGLMLWMRCG